MSLLSIFEISGSALAAQSQRLNVAASNLANADSVAGPDGQPYRARQVVFQMNPALGQAAGQEIGGVKVAAVVEDASPLKMVFDPKNPMADAQGYVAMPNVDPVAETVNMIAASRSYQANIEVLNTAKQLMQRTLTIGQS
ncbi:flagellar basal body rod protein FlgC [Bordetella avium]|uniref:Flagellar basal-body rod protein FlgC n=1 Tax=Bordetella avium (strain 197N) TaxID=360910 RepID=Q2L1B8_BORA1|nr:flagellar basal body rod protein FlgC [Bordetella avium]AZY49068.1 flagellar basal body rod protein FlgC [Bordetella avium]AZY52426.1 flagellar basal body rod protein FlgC [Bordetella avium]RIQ11523.1 flagellar basal body rod protein FlgC [Bordetella avium]RIQ15928.1 flagellar basal body rod protein FlgC [Bordetella avium]RIQ30148.1 flagellar basal body rod protein FlgC [Bordetella avium]